MKTKAVRIYGKKDLRLEEFELPAIKKDEILAHIISDSICMSSYKAAIQGSDHKRVPKDIDKNPTIIGHEFCGEIIEVGDKWKEKFKPGDKFTIQPALNYKGSLDAPGYSYRYIGGNATYVIIPNEVMEMNCLLNYKGEAFFHGSLAEPMSCIVGAFHASYHTVGGSYVHNMGIVEGGNMAILAGVGPMGLGAIDYAIHCDRKPGLLVVTDIDDSRLQRAKSIFTEEEARKNGITLIYVNTRDMAKPEEYLLSLTDGKGYDDVFVFAPVKPVIETGDRILGRDGCLNFFAGPTDPNFTAEFNFYNVHYASTHIVGTSGGNTDDMIESLEMMEKGLLNPAVMITHIGGLNSVIDTTLNLPNIPGGKKLIYNNIDLELTAIQDFKEKGKTDPMFAKLAEIVKANNGLWCLEAEKYLLANAKPIE
ncbi:MAG: zinc-binding dehydrogenase [Mahellales bacterium]|jgi:threonine dehydrogenase-like Zn-dependent dehydrogenase